MDCDVDLNTLSGESGHITGASMNKIDTITLHVGHTVEVEVTPLIQDSINIARTSRQMGSTKIDAVRRVYPRLASLTRESIWYVIIHGVDLSSRGAVTYYYNMRKESKRHTRT